MRLFEAIMEANRAAGPGDSRAPLLPSDYSPSLPVVALTCIDPRLNKLFPDVLGVRAEDFIWLRNAGNIIFDPLSSMMRTLALACAIKGGKEIAVIGHSDCRVRQVSVNQLIESFRALGVQRSNLPDNILEFFGLFASERQNVIKGTTHIRHSPLISPHVPVHGLLVDVQSGKLEWLVNGYEHLAMADSTSRAESGLEKVQEIVSAFADFHLGEMNFPQVKIGDLTIDPKKWMSEVETVKQKIHDVLPHHTAEPKPPTPPSTASAGGKPTPPNAPVPPPIVPGKEWMRPKK